MLLVCPALLFSTQAPSQELKTTPATLLNRAVQSIGGAKQLNKLDSFQLHGIMRLADERPVVEIELSTRKGGLVLGIMTYIGVGQTKFGSDGTTSWEQKLNESGDISWDIISSAALSKKVQQMNWLEWFTMLPLELDNMEIIGEQTFDNELCWIVQINKEKINEQLVYFSKKTFRPKGRRTEENTANGKTIVDVFFRDWERVGDLLLFHTIVYRRDGNEITLKLDRIQLDKARKELFELPAEIQLLQSKP